VRNRGSSRVSCKLTMRPWAASATAGKPDRGSESKQAFVIAVETDETLEHPTYAVIEALRTFDNEAITDWARRRLKPEAEVFSDGLGAFRCFAIDHAHTVLESEGGRAATQMEGARWANLLLSNVKRSIRGANHAYKQHKYAGCYLTEAACRFNRRAAMNGMP
jgi:hypothetical protein